MYERRAAILLTLALLLSCLSAVTARAAGERVAAYGADLTPAERQELVDLFGADGGTRNLIVTAQELVAALGGTGLPVTPNDQAVSSSIVTCLSEGEGLTVGTRSITRIPVELYANALLTAGVDGVVFIAAPAAHPVSGETALVGVLKAFTQCPGAQAPDPARVRLAYDQVARTIALAGPAGDLTKAAQVMARATQAVIAGGEKDEVALGAALDGAASAEGLGIDPAQRDATVAFLKQLRGLDYGKYARGYQVRPGPSNQVNFIPTGASAPATPRPPTPAQPAVAPAPATATASPASSASPPPARSVARESLDRLVAAFVAYVPRLAGALALLVAGFIAALLARGVTSFTLRRLHFDDLCAALGLTAVLRAGNIRRGPAQLVGSVVFCAIVLLAFLAALGPLGLGFLAGTLRDVILYAPRLLLAGLLLVLGVAVARRVAEAALRVLAEVGVTRAGGVGGLVRFGLIFIAAVLAAAVLGIDVTLLVALAVIGVSTLALTAALALGLGLRGLSHNIAAGRYVSEGLVEGERISVNGVSGTVERIGHAQTVLRAPNGRAYLIPNGYFLDHVVEKEEQAGGGERGEALGG